MYGAGKCGHDNKFKASFGFHFGFLWVKLKMPSVSFWLADINPLNKDPDYKRDDSYPSM